MAAGGAHPAKLLQVPSGHDTGARGRIQEQRSLSLPEAPDSIDQERKLDPIPRSCTPAAEIDDEQL